MTAAARMMAIAAATTLLAVALTVALLWRPAPDPGWAPPHPVDREALAGIDLHHVHAELWPGLVASLQADAGAQQDAHVALRQAVAADPNLADLVDEVVGLTADPVASAPALLQRARAWNDYLDAHGLPWRLALSVHVHPDDAQILVKTYRVVADARTIVGDRSTRTRVVTRADRTALVEAWLGTTVGDGGALLQLDRIVVFALDRVWPLLDPALDDRRDAVDRAFAPSIRASAARALPEHVEVLANTAAGRFFMGRAADAVHDRHGCGSRFVIGEIPFDGLAVADLRVLSRYAAASDRSPCPDVTREEALLFRLHSDALQAEPELQPALEALVAWIARAFAVHEARHVADAEQTGAEPPPCPGCPDALPVEGRRELSAYVASFVDPELGGLALYQACRLDPRQVPVRAEVVRWVADRLGDACAEGPPDDLPERARALEVELFGRSEPIRVDDAFPRGLPLRPR